MTFLLKSVLFIIFVFSNVESSFLKMSGPGMGAHIIMPARYYFLDLEGFPKSSKEDFNIIIKGINQLKKTCRIWTEVLDRKDNFFIVRYKLYEKCTQLNITGTYQGDGLGLIMHTDVLPDDCLCPIKNLENFLEAWKCKSVPNLLDKQLKKFGTINWDTEREEVIEAFNKPLSMSLCHYVIKENKIYRRCYGKKTRLPDVEFFTNLGDWPLSTMEHIPKTYPIFSWCGSEDSFDITWPTYELTESVLENMGRECLKNCLLATHVYGERYPDRRHPDARSFQRLIDSFDRTGILEFKKHERERRKFSLNFPLRTLVSVNTLSVQGNLEYPWEFRIPKLFWRGRDSNKHRLKLIQLAKRHPDLFNVSLTNFFFYKNEEDIYGPKTEHVSFYSFFDYKYQLAIDGTVAPYRMPFLLAGGSLIFKPESKYFEYFYKDMKPYVHYVPVMEDLDDLVEKIMWAQQNDEKAKTIAKNGQNFANEQISPLNVFCYHAHVLNEFSKIVTSPIRVLEGMEEVKQDKLQDCGCYKNKKENNLKEKEHKLKDEL